MKTDDYSKHAFTMIMASGHPRAPEAVCGLSRGEAERFFQELCRVRARAEQGAEAIYPESQSIAGWSAFEDDLLEVCEQESRGKYGVTKKQQTEIIMVGIA